MHPNDTTLNGYADGTLNAAERPGVEQHLAGCAICGETVDDLREILRATGDLELREPPVRAWSRLERAIRMEREHAGASARRPLDGARGGPSVDRSDGPARAGRYRSYATWLAAAAAVLIATAVGLRYAPARRVEAPGAASGSSAAVTAGETAQSIETELRQAESHYEKAIKGLETIANSGQGELDPGTAATLQKNLAVIDQAISESRAAVRSQPASEPAQQSLIDGFKTKIGLLQDTVALINEMRKGNEAGAARIASGLKQKGT
jgi:anti-sigma factor ChrR (cupin superfamily)